MKLVLTIASAIIMCVVTPTVYYSNSPVYFQWTQLDFHFPSQEARTGMINSGAFNPLNCVPGAIKICGNMVFMATPRYRSGVPSTLNMFHYTKPFMPRMMTSHGPLLQPFPSWEMQQIGNCGALQSVVALELDIYNRLWIVDTGRIETFTPTPKNVCPAKLVIFDLMRNLVERVFEFPDAVVSRTTNYLKEIQVGCTSREDCFAYISNANLTCNIVVYDHRNGDAWQATHYTMQPDSSKASLVINGVSLTTMFGIAGLGLIPRTSNYSTLFYSKLAGDRIYAVSTAALQNKMLRKKNALLPDNMVMDLGMKMAGQADGAVMDNCGRWYFGSLPRSGVYYVDTRLDPRNITMAAMKVIENSVELEYPEKFTLDGQGNLLFVSSKFHKYLMMMINPEQVNFRLYRIWTNTYPYYM